MPRPRRLKPRRKRVRSTKDQPIYGIRFELAALKLQLLLHHKLASLSGNPTTAINATRKKIGCSPNPKMRRPRTTFSEQKERRTISQPQTVSKVRTRWTAN